jgi:hypothetical protein
VADNELLELYKQHRTGQDKYAYFLLAIVASAIAFAVNKTTDVKITSPDIPLILAVILWGFSFYFGCKYLQWCQTATFSNFNLLQLVKGVHPEQPDHPVMVEAAIKAVKSALESNSDNAGKYSNWQFYFAVLGALMFLIWHGIKIYIYTVSL